MKLRTLPHFGLMASLLFILFFTSLPARAQLGPPELSVMNILRDNFGWGAAFGWTNGNPCPSLGNNWNGVTCQDRQDRRVDKLDLTCGAVKLNLPTARNIYALTLMREYTLRSCYAGGIQATEFSGTCMDNQNGCMNSYYGFTNMPQLTKIRLDTGQIINGTISELFRESVMTPAQNGLNPTRFSFLTTLYLTDTKMSGTIPDGVMLFSSATDIRLNYDSFSGSLPATGNVSKNIWLNGNRLEGVLPDYIVNATGNVSVRYNKFDVVNTPAGNIDLLDPNWRATQTVPPTSVQARPLVGHAAELTWMPIAYQNHGGYYEVLSAASPGGPYTSLGTTEMSGGKMASSLIVSNLPDGVNYFVVRTFTPAHTGVFPNGCTQEVDCVTENNPNDLTSVLSAETSADVTYTPVFTSWYIALQNDQILYGNPINVVVNDLKDQFDNFISQNLTVKVLQNSNSVLSQNFDVQTKPSTLAVNNSLLPGNYTLEVYSGNTRLESFSFSVTYIPALQNYNAQLNKTVFNTGESYQVTLDSFVDQFNNSYLPASVGIEILNADTMQEEQSFTLLPNQSGYSHSNLVPQPGNKILKVIADGVEKTFNFTVNGSVLFNFTGFLQPISNTVSNQVKAGSAVPVKFSLNGNQGLNIFAAGFPSSVPVTCAVGEPIGTIDETVSAGGSGLSYDAATDTYSYIWKTEKSWKGSCRLLRVKLTDSQTYTAKFQFK